MSVCLEKRWAWLDHFSQIRTKLHKSLVDCAFDAHTSIDQQEERILDGFQQGPRTCQPNKLATLLMCKTRIRKRNRTTNTSKNIHHKLTSIHAFDRPSNRPINQTHILICWVHHIKYTQYRREPSHALSIVRVLVLMVQMFKCSNARKTHLISSSQKSKHRKVFCRVMDFEFYIWFVIRPTFSLCDRSLPEKIYLWMLNAIVMASVWNILSLQIPDCSMSLTHIPSIYIRFASFMLPGFENTFHMWMTTPPHFKVRKVTYVKRTDGYMMVNCS